MDKPTKPTNLMPRSFGGVKNNWTASMQSSGYEDGVPAIYGGDNLNYQLDTTGKELDYCEKICDFINDIPIGKTITVDSNNKLIYENLATDISGKANIGLDNLSSVGEKRVLPSQIDNMGKYLSTNGDSPSWVSPTWANQDLDNLSQAGEAKIMNKIPNCVIKGNLAVTGQGLLDLVDAQTSQDYSQTITYSQPGTYTFNIPANGTATVTLVGGGGGGAVTTALGQWAYLAGGGSGAAFVGTVNLSAGNYTVVVGDGGNGYVGNPNGGSGTDGGNTSLIFNGTTLLNCTGGKGGYSEINGGITGGGYSNGGDGGTVTTNVQIVNTQLNSSGNKGISGSTDPRPVTSAGGASVYQGYGKGGDANAYEFSAPKAINGYFSVTYTSTISGSTTVNWKVTPNNSLVINKPNGETVTLTGVNSDYVTGLANGTYHKFVDENGSELIVNRYVQYKEPTTPTTGAVWTKIGQSYRQFKYNGSDWEEYNKVLIGVFTVNNGSVLSFGNYSLYYNGFDFHNSFNDRSLMARFSMPSGVFIELTLGATGTQYVAPTTGWFYINATINTYAYFDFHNTTRSNYRQLYASSGTNSIRGMFPVTAGDVITCNYNNLNNVEQFRFYYAQGEV